MSQHEEKKEAEDASTASLRWFTLAGGRETLTAVRTEELVAALKKEVAEKGSEVYDAVRLSGKSFDAASARVMAAALRLLKGVKVVDFSDTISGQLREEVVVALRELCAAAGEWELESIDFSDNALGLDGVNAVAPALTTQKALKKVFFNNNGLDSDAVARITEILLDVPSRETLTTFHIFNNMMGSDGAVALAPLLEALPALADLRVSTTRIGSAGGMALVQALGKRKERTLVKLDLSDNSLGAEAGEHLAATTLKKQPLLRHVLLGDTAIDEEGAVAVCNALVADDSNTESLVEVSLSHADLTRRGAKAVAKLVRAKKNLQSLNLEGNELMRKGTEIVCAALVDCGVKLRSLNLSENRITGKAADSIAALIKSDASPVSLHLNGNMINAAGLATIRAAIVDTELGNMSDNEEDWSDDDDDDEESDGDDEVDNLADDLADKL